MSWTMSDGGNTGGSVETGSTARDRTIHRALRRKAEEHGNRDFFYYKDQVFGYEDLDRESDKVAAGLQKLGVKKGDFVAIEMKNRPEFLKEWSELRPPDELLKYYGTYPHPSVGIAQMPPMPMMA